MFITRFRFLIFILFVHVIGFRRIIILVVYSPCLKKKDYDFQITNTCHMVDHVLVFAETFKSNHLAGLISCSEITALWFGTRQPCVGSYVTSKLPVPHIYLTRFVL